MRISLLLGVLSAFFIVFASPAYAFDESFWCSLDARVGDLQRLTCFNGTNTSIMSGGLPPFFWSPTYLEIPNNYSAKLVNVSVYVGIRHDCAGELNVDLISPNKTRVRLSKMNHTGQAFCPTDQFPDQGVDSNVAPYTPIWIDNGTSLPSPWLNGASDSLLEINIFNGTLGSFFGDNVNGNWVLNSTDPIGLNVGLVDFWALSIMMRLSIDYVPPNYHNNITQTAGVYDPNALSNFSVLWNDTNSSISAAYMENNFTGTARNDSLSGYQTSANNFLYHYNLTLPAGVFQYRYYANDSAGNWNKTDIYYASVNKGNITYTVSFNGTASSDIVSYAYGINSNVTVFKPATEGNVSVFFNNGSGQQFIGTNTSSVTHIAILPAGYTFYRFVFNETQNYTQNETTLVFNVSRSFPALNVSFLPGSSVTYAISTTTWCNITRGDSSAILGLWFNYTYLGAVPGNRSASAIISAGPRNVTCRYYSSQNFTGKTSSDNILTILKAVPALNLTFDMNEGNKTIAKCHSLNATAWTSASQGQIILYKENSTHTVNPVNGSVNATYIAQQCEAAGSQINFTAFYPERQNYTAAVKSFFAFMDSSPPGFFNNFSTIRTSASEDNFSANFTVNWEDNLGVSSAFLEHNFSGVFSNQTMGISGSLNYFNTSVNSGAYAFRFIANDTSDLWNATDYLILSVSYSPPVAPPSNPPSGGGGGGGGGGSSATTTTTTTTTTITTANTITTTVKPNVLIAGFRIGDVASETVGNETAQTQQSDADALITGMAFAVRNPIAVAASLAVLGVVAVNYLVGFDRVAESGKVLKKKLAKKLRRIRRGLDYL